MENSSPGTVQNQYGSRWTQHDYIFNSSYHSNVLQQHPTPPTHPVTPNSNLQWNALWPPPPFAHLQHFPPPPLPPPTHVQQFWPRPPNEGSHVTGSDFKPVQTHSFTPQHYGVDVTSGNKQSPDNGSLSSSNPSLTSIVDDEIEEKTQKQKNQEFLNEFIKNRCKNLTLETPSSLAKVNISTMQVKLKECIELMNELDSIKQNLQSSLEHDGLVWNLLAQQASEIKKNLQSSLMDLNHVELGSLEAYVQKRCRKRGRLQRQKLMKNEEKREREKQTKRLHEKIDSWQEAIRHSHSAIEMERKLKKEADSILSEVRRKRAEANRMLDLVRSISKLRDLKKQAAANKGLFTTSECDETFASNIFKLEKLLIARLAEYSEEERTLQVMLDEEHQVTRDSAIKTRQLEQKEKLEIAKKQKSFWLFGPEATINNMDPRYIYREYYTRPERNLDALIQVRQSWDIWLVPPTTLDSSGIPLTWVIPTKPSSSAWASYLGEQLP